MHSVLQQTSIKICRIQTSAIKIIIIVIPMSTAFDRKQLHVAKIGINKTIVIKCVKRELILFQKCNFKIAIIATKQMAHDMYNIYSPEFGLKKRIISNFVFWHCFAE